MRKVVGIVMLAVLALSSLIGFPIIAKAESNTYFKGEILEIFDEGTSDEGIDYQDIEVEFDNGKVVRIHHGGGPFMMDNFDKVEVGDDVVVGKMDQGDGETYFIQDKYRLNGIYLMVAIFFILVVVFGRIKGLASFAGLGFTVLILAFVILPLILNGFSPIISSLFGAFLITLVSIYISHGFSRRTTVAVLGTLSTLVLAFILSYVFISLTRLSGFGTEEAFFLQFEIAGIDFRGLLLGGIIIGTLGILDDITTAQAAVVDELYRLNNKQRPMDVYMRAVSVGQEHIASLVNTLFLAYMGASFPLLLLFWLNNSDPVWVILNGEIMAEEIVRTLVGSMALVLAVPITTLLAVYILKDRLGLSLSNHSHHLH